MKKQRVFILTLLSVALMVTPAMANKTIYLDGNGIWDIDNAKLIIHYWGSGDGDAVLNQVSGHIFKADIPDGCTGLLFKRLSPSCTDYSTWCNREGYWGKTLDQTAFTTGKDLCKITGWTEEQNDWCGDKSEAKVGVATCEWSTYDSGSGQGGQGGGGDQPTAYWYYKGWVDGGDIQNEEGGFNIFKCGTVSITVGENAYLFVMYQEKGVPGVQYMTTAYVDGPTHATMVTSGTEKLHVGPGSYTLYLYDNGDGSVELSTEPLSGKTLVSANCGGGATSIQVVAVTLDPDAPMYDVLGRKVGADYKGIVIQNGHKFVR